MERGSALSSPEARFWFWHGTWYRLKNKMSLGFQRHKTKSAISTIPKSAVALRSVGCMWGNAYGYSTKVPRGHLLLTKDLSFGGFIICQDRSHHSCWRCWQAAMWMLGSCIGLKTTCVQKDHLLLLPSLDFPALQYETEKERTDGTLKGRMNDLCYQTQDIYLLCRWRLSMPLRR